MDTSGLSDTYLCSCVQCRRFEKLAFADAELLRSAAEARIHKTCSLTKDKADIKIGDRVIIRGQYAGVVRYVGVLDEELIGAPLYVGVQLDDNVESLEGGFLKGRFYFRSTPGHGVMVKYSEVEKVKAYSKRPPICGNTMYPSYKEICQARKQRGCMVSELEKVAASKKRQTTRQPNSKKSKTTGQAKSANKSKTLDRTTSPTSHRGNKTTSTSSGGREKMHGGGEGGGGVALTRAERTNMHEAIARRTREAQRQLQEDWEEQRHSKENYLLQVHPSINICRKYRYQYIKQSPH